MARLALSIAFLLLRSSSSTAASERESAEVKPSTDIGQDAAGQKIEVVAAEQSSRMENVWAMSFWFKDHEVGVDYTVLEDEAVKVLFNFGSLGTVFAHMWKLALPAGRFITFRARLDTEESLKDEERHTWYQRFCPKNDFPRFSARTGEKFIDRAEVGDCVQGKFWFSEDEAHECNSDSPSGSNLSSKTIDFVEYMYAPGPQEEKTARRVCVVSVSNEHVWTLKADRRQGFGQDDGFQLEVSVTTASVESNSLDDLKLALPERKRAAMDEGNLLYAEFEGKQTPERKRAAMDEGNLVYALEPKLAKFVIWSVVVCSSIILFYYVWALCCYRKAANYEDDGGSSCNAGSEAWIELAVVP